MAKTLAGLLAVSIAALLFASCGRGASSTEPSATSSTTAAKSVVSTFCGEKSVRTNQEQADDALAAAMAAINHTPLPNPGHIFFVWSDGSTTESSQQCNC